MRKVLVTGAGKIGLLISCLLADSNDYQVFLADIDFSHVDPERLAAKNLQIVKLDVTDKKNMDKFAKKHQLDVVISSLPYFCNLPVAEFAHEHQLHYFDLTEDMNVTNGVKELAQGAKNAFVPQCGLAPGFIGIVANSLIQKFDSVESVKMRVGALPINSNNALQYSLTWSTDGLLNEYGNPCFGIRQGELTVMHPLEALESIQIDGLSYEAFNTSGGLGSLPELYVGKVDLMNYKTIRYPGHCGMARLLMQDLKLNQDRDTLKRILENAIPKTYQDVILIYVSVTGKQGAEFIEENYFNKVYPQIIAGQRWSAIQVTTASGICAVADIVLTNSKKYQGFVYQEQISLHELLNNRFGRNYETRVSNDEHPVVKICNLT